MKNKGIWIILLLFFMSFLPSMLLANNDRGFEVILHQPKTMTNDSLSRVGTSGIGQFGFLSDVVVENANGKSLNTIKVKGNLSSFIKGTSGNVSNHYRSDTDLIISKLASRKLFFTSDGVNNEVTINNNKRVVRDVVDFEGLSMSSKTFDALVPVKGDIAAKRVLFSNKTLDGMVVKKNDVDRFLNELGISQYQINSYSELREYHSSMALLTRLLLVIMALGHMALQYKRGKYSFKEDWWLLALVGYLVYQLMAIPFTKLPLELITENLVSLTYYVNQAIRLPSNLYQWLNSPMSYQMFTMRIMIISVGIYYFMILVGSLVIMRKEVHHE